MRKYIELEQEDIQEIIAKHFNTSIDNVEFDIFEDCEGYGPMEHTVTKFKATVEEAEDGKID